jgi:hypothetical protein
MGRKDILGGARKDSKEYINLEKILFVINN